MQIPIVFHPEYFINLFVAEAAAPGLQTVAYPEPEEVLLLNPVNIVKIVYVFTVYRRRGNKRVVDIGFNYMTQSVEPPECIAHILP